MCAINFGYLIRKLTKRNYHNYWFFFLLIWELKKRTKSYISYSWKDYAYQPFICLIVITSHPITLLVSFFFTTGPPSFLVNITVKASFLIPASNTINAHALILIKQRQLTEIQTEKKIVGTSLIN